MAFYPVPGSEVFASRLVSREATRAAVPSNLALFEVDADAKDNLDPLTYEVIRHSLWAITEAMGQALIRMSGSLVVTECTDFEVAIADELGDMVQMGPFVTSLCACADLGIKWIIEHRSENPGIGPGDMFLCNDPWVGGGMHQNDVAIIAPLFHEDQLFCWTVAVAHQVDLGGVSPGSWSPAAQDVFWESLPTPPVKIVRNGVLQRDIEDLYLRRSRVPKIVALDLRAKIGASQVGHDRLSELIGKYGARTVKAAMSHQLDDAEARLRAKLERIEDGQWSASIYQEQANEGDRGLYRVVCTLTKTGSDLTLDFTGTDDQAGMINCPFPGLYGGAISAMLPILCGDLPWAIGGIRRCLTFISEPGTLNDATFPAAVGKAPVSASFATVSVVADCLSQMTDSSEELSDLSTAMCSGSWDMCILAGLDQRGNPFATMLTDSMAAGMGAGVDHDGVDTGGFLETPQGRIPDVEMAEFMFPMLYLWRREEVDSGGPGEYRGGMTVSTCFTPHDTDTEMAQVASGTGKALPQALGMAGGYPGCTQSDLVIRDSNVADLLARGAIPRTLQEVDGRLEVLGCEQQSVLRPGDVQLQRPQAGGGYGDPLKRDPGSVATDVATFRVSERVAREIYGVVLADGAVDEAATDSQRLDIRQRRRQGSWQPAPAHVVTGTQA